VTNDQITLRDCIGTLQMNLMDLRGRDLEAYLLLASEWLDMLGETNLTKQDVIKFEERVITACEEAR
jgi:hypothetical protein